MSDSGSTPPDEVIDLLTQLRSLRKYRHLNLPDATLLDLLEQELPRHRSQKEALHAVREKLHNIVAPYLGDPDYAQAASDLRQAFTQGLEAVKRTCLVLLSAHASTRERIPLLEDFYPRLWRVTGKPASLLDLACGLHPFGLPWMGLDAQTAYYAYDIHKPRIELINEFLRLSSQHGRAYHEDVLVHPPPQEADVALFFKEAHRFEQRQRGCNLPFWQALKVQWLLISLPSRSLSGTRDLADQQRRLIHAILAGKTWEVTELTFENELVFCIRKS